MSQIGHLAVAEHSAAVVDRRAKIVAATAFQVDPYFEYQRLPKWTGSVAVGYSITRETHW